MNKKILKDYRLWAVLICACFFAVLGIMNLLKVTIPTAQFGAASCAFIYVATALPLIIFFIFSAIRLKKSRTLIYISAMLLLSYFIRILFADFKSSDYICFLSEWMKEYRTLSIKDCFIKQVGNYPPVYNYFLIAFSRINIYDLYLIKTLSFYFEALTVFFAVKLVCLVRKESFNYLWAAIFFILPVPFTNSSQWAQCDTMYTMTVVAGIYFALRKNSPMAYIFVGLGLAFKMQTVLILPVGLALLFARDTDGKKYLLWRYIWIVPLVFFVASGLPVFFGGSFFKVIAVYFDQVSAGNEGQALNGDCANILLPFKSIAKGSVAYYILLVLFLLITAATDIFIIYKSLKDGKQVLTAQNVLMLCVLLPLNSVFFMPKMLDRFYYIAEMFLIIYFATYRDKNAFTAYVLLETAQWLMYTRALLKIFGLYVIAPIFSVCSLIIAYSMFFQTYPFARCQKLNALTAFITVQPAQSLPEEQPTEEIQQQ